ncbi:MAG: hypothetical protein ACLQQ4_15915 [Bacteroidia bacterium]
MNTFTLIAKVSTDNPKAIATELKKILAGASIKADGNDFIVQATLSGESTRELNRGLLSALRKVEKKTRLRAEWKSGNIVEKYFDYVPKSIKTL